MINSTSNSDTSNSATASWESDGKLGLNVDGDASIDSFEAKWTNVFSGSKNDLVGMSVKIPSPKKEHTEALKTKSLNFHKFAKVVSDATGLARRSHFHSHRIQALTTKLNNKA